ncbi:MAG: mechanosensitive ion channel family protein [Pseudomonadota bacterium]|nr:mechanosensitive ion channel family protein [Pseudomonadota bacterium]
MNSLNFNIDTNTLIAFLSAAAIKVLVALLLWFLGRWLIAKVVNMVRRALTIREVDPTLTRYGLSILNISLNILLVVGILGYFGIQTTTFAAVVAAAGVAIGLAWSGLLANFAAGVFLIILRPFKTGDFIRAGGVTGTVTEVGIFATTINTMDNVSTIVGNNKIFADNIENYSTNAFRRVDLQIQLAGSVDPAQAANLLKHAVMQIPNVLGEPTPDIEILEFTLVGPVLAVRPYAHTDHYWQVYFDTNRVIRETLLQAGFAAPMPAQMVVVQQQA